MKTGRPKLQPPFKCYKCEIELIPGVNITESTFNRRQFRCTVCRNKIEADYKQKNRTPRGRSSSIECIDNVDHPCDYYINEKYGGV